MLSGTYIGPVKALKGKTALLKVHKRWAFAQFDEFHLWHLGQWLSHGWHKFQKKHWVIS